MLIKCIGIGIVDFSLEFEAYSSLYPGDLKGNNGFSNLLFVGNHDMIRAPMQRREILSAGLGGKDPSRVSAMD